MVMASIIMLVGIGMRLAPRLINWNAPITFLRISSLVIVFGAMLEIIATWRFVRTTRNQSPGNPYQ